MGIPRDLVAKRAERPRIDPLWLARRAPLTVWCMVCTYLPTRDFLVLNGVAREWPLLVRMPAALPPRLAVPLGAKACREWHVASLSAYRPRILRIDYQLSTCDMNDLARLTSIHTLDIRPDCSLAPLRLLPRLTTLVLALHEVSSSRIGELRDSAVTDLTVHIHSSNYRGRGGVARTRHRLLASPSSLPRQLLAFRTSATMCVHGGTPPMSASHWPPQLVDLSAYQLKAWSLPATLTALTLRQIEPGRLNSILRLPLLHRLDVGPCDLSGIERALSKKEQASKCGLGSLRMARCALGDSGFAAVCRLLNPDTLRLLDITGNLELRDMAPLSAFSCLEKLHLDDTHVGDLGSLLRRCPSTLSHIPLPTTLMCDDLPDDTTHSPLGGVPAASTGADMSRVQSTDQAVEDATGPRTVRMALDSGTRVELLGRVWHVCRLILCLVFLSYMI